MLDTGSKIINIRDEKNKSLINYIEQDFNLLPELNCIQNIIISKQIVNEKITKKEVIKILNQFEINKDIYYNKAKNLSLGEQQLISIIIAYIRKSSILILDEPTSNLDQDSKFKIFSLLKKISKTKTVIIASHDQQNTNAFADNIIKIENSYVFYTKKTTKVSEYKNIENFSSSVNEEKSISRFINNIKTSHIISITNFKKNWVY